MRELTADMFLTLDGFSADAEGTQRWVHGGPDFARCIQEVLAEPQVLVLGRVTYQTLAAGFGSSAAGTDPVTDRMNAVPKLVFSNTLEEPLAWANARLASRTLAEEITALKKEAGDPLRTVGSIQVVRSLMGLGLVDRIRLMVFPLILGRNGRKPLFAEYSETALERVGSTVLDTNVMLLEYRPRAHA